MVGKRAIAPTWAAAMVVVLSVALVATACSSDNAKRATGSTTTTAAIAAGTTPRDEAIEARIEAKGVTVELARSLYVAVIGALPGVPDPPGPPSTSQSGTRALGRILSVFDQLTAAQQTAVLRHMGVGAPESTRSDPALSDVTPLDDPPDPLATTTSTSTSRGRSVASRHHRTLRADQIPPASFFDPYVAWANKAISQRTGAPQITKIRIHVDDTTTPSAVADTIYFDKTDIPLTEGKKYIDREAMLDACQITVYSEKFKGFDPAAIASVLSHEVFHCYQQRQVGSLAKSVSVDGWLHDGEATWVMMELVPSAVYPQLQAPWTQYISTPQHRPLFTRTYDAVGFFGHIEDMEGPEQIWPHLLQAFSDGIGGANEVSFATMLQGVEDVVMDFWGASYWRKFPDKIIWDMLGPGKADMPSFGAAPEQVTVGKSQTVALPNVDPYENLPVRVIASTEIVEVVNGRGHLAVASGDHLNDVIPAGSSVFYCVQDEPCVCPKGTTGSPPPAVQAGGGGLALGLTGARTGSSGQVRGYSLDDYCKKDPKPPGKPPAGGGGGGGDPGGDASGGRVYADPHLRTFDGRRYDLQAIGEFTLTRSTVDDFEVQVRLAAMFTGAPATNTVAVATKVGADRITLAMSDLDPTHERRIVLKVDGTEAPAGSLPKLAAGSLRRVRGVNGESVDVTYPDGSTMRVRLGAALDVAVVPAAARAGKLTGLLGDFNGVVSDDPTIGPGGTPLSAAPSFDEVYASLAPAWRLTQDRSLLDYDAGQSTATFTDTNFPDRTLRASDQAIADAKAYCTAIGIADPGLYDDCVFDESNTHDRRTAYAYQEQQRFLAWSASGANGSAPSSGQATTYEGKVTSTTDRPVYTLALKQGDIVDIGGETPTCHSDPHLAAELTDPTGLSIGTSGDVCTFGRVEAKVSGTYQLTMNSLGEGDSGGWKFAVTPVRADRLSDITAGAVLSGTIEDRAEHDVWRFQGTAGQPLTLSGSDCAGPVGAHLIAPDGTLEEPFSSLCDVTAVILHSSGAYELQINADNNRTGAYSAKLSLG